MKRGGPLVVISIIAGITILGYGLATTPHLGDAKYHHDVERVEVSEGDRPAAMAYENLSAEGQRAFDRAIESDDGRGTVYGQDARPPEFEYGGQSMPEPQRSYLIEYDGEFYRVETVEESPTLGMLTFFASYGAVSVFVIVIGGYVFYRS